jgi:hypothetical protein
MRYGAVAGMIWRRDCSYSSTHDCTTHQGFLICSSVMLFTGASCATPGAARAAGTESCCVGVFFQAQKPSASVHELVAGLVSALAGGCAGAGGGVTVVAVGAMAAGFSLFAAAAATSLNMGK